MDRLAQFASDNMISEDEKEKDNNKNDESNEDKQSAMKIFHKTNVFETFQKYCKNIIENHKGMKLEDMLSLQVALINFAAQCYPEKHNYIASMLDEAVEMIVKFDKKEKLGANKDISSQTNTNTNTKGGVGHNDENNNKNKNKESQNEEPPSEIDPIMSEKIDLSTIEPSEININQTATEHISKMLVTPVQSLALKVLQYPSYLILVKFVKNDNDMKQIAVDIVRSLVNLPKSNPNIYIETPEQV